MSVLYISDLDGTLLARNGRLSRFSRTTLQELLAEGLPFSVASARSVASIRAVLDGLPLELPVIELNGALISDLHTGRHEVINAIAPEVAEDIYGLLVARGHGPIIATFDGQVDCLYHSALANEGMQWYVADVTAQANRAVRCPDDLTDALADRVLCITVIGRYGPLAELELALGERHGASVEMHLFENPYSRGWYWLTVHDRRATKAQGVRTLVEMCGLRTEELVVFGDEVNDIKIFEIAAHAVAVENAHPRLKSVATHVIGSNEADSVAKYMRAHWASRASAPANGGKAEVNALE